jgi:hypothetical protein
MNYLKLLSLALPLIASTAAIANSPPGSLELLRPTVSRYAVSLALNFTEENQGHCPEKWQRELVLIDQTGNMAQAPFTVPLLSSFVLTDVTWSARPTAGSSTPPPPFDPDQEVELQISRMGPNAGMNSVLVEAERVTPIYAGGQHAFTTGPTFGMLQSLCVGVLLPDRYGGRTADIYNINVFGYVDDWKVD